jgi:hypothetical protein
MTVANDTKLCALANFTLESSCSIAWSVIGLDEEAFSYEVSPVNHDHSRAELCRKYPLARKSHKKTSKAATIYCKLLLLNKLSLIKRTPLR